MESLSSNNGKRSSEFLTVASSSEDSREDEYQDEEDCKW
jgi:hypothetical protein